MQTQHKIQLQDRLKSIGFGLIFVVTGLLAGYFGGKLLRPSAMLQVIGPENGGEKILFIALALFGIWSAIALHELGHLLAGLAQGFRLALYTAGLLGVRGTERGPKLFFNRSINMLGGLAATFPERIISGPDLRRKFAWIVAAGPLASLVTGIVCLTAVWMIYPHLPVAAGWPVRAGLALLLTTGAMSALIFVVTSLPLPSRGFMTDGARLLSLSKGGEKGQREEAGLAVMALMGAGKLPGEYPSDLLRHLTTLPANTLLGLNGNFTAFTHHLDRGDVESALPFAEAVEVHIGAVPAGPFRRYYLKDLVFFYAFLAKDVEKARAIWAGIEKGADKDRDTAGYRAKAALALGEGQYQQAAAFVEAGLKKVSDLPFHGQRRFEEKWLGAVAENIREMYHNSK